VLTDLLNKMIVNAGSAEERERLILLAEALTLPDTEMSLTDVFLGQTLVLVGIGAAVLLLGVALLITLVPAVQKGARKRSLENEQQAILDEIREEMGELLQGNDIFVGQADAVSRPKETEKEPSELEKIVIDAESEVEEEEEEAEIGAEDEEENGETKAPEEDEDDPYLILDDNEDEDEEEEVGGDPIFDLFQEDDDSSQEIDRLANPLPQIHMSDVLELSQQVVTQFREYILRPVN